MDVNTTFAAPDLNEVAFVLASLEQIDNATASAAESDEAVRVYIPVGTEITVAIGSVEDEGSFYGTLTKDDEGSWLFTPATPAYPTSTYITINGVAPQGELPTQFVHDFFD